jgi:hypothetical protein
MTKTQTELAQTIENLLHEATNLADAPSMHEAITACRLGQGWGAYKRPLIDEVVKLTDRVFEASGTAENLKARRAIGQVFLTLVVDVAGPDPSDERNPADDTQTILKALGI